MEAKKIIISYFDNELKAMLNAVEPSFFNEIEEIRVRVNKPLIIINKNKEWFLDKEGNITNDFLKAYKTSSEQIAKAIEQISNYSMYAFSEELKNGYITLMGGHRIGITGRAVIENGEVKTLKNINGLNIRVAHEVKGCAQEVVKHIIDSNLLNTIIISPPGCGKTTLLRDIIRNLSDGVPGLIIGQSVGVADERSEIGGCYRGVPQNDLGIRTDILDGCPKAQGMIMLLRSMSPKVIAVDEIGKKKDIEAIDDILNAGVKLVCTIHGYSIEDIEEKAYMKEVISRKIFDRYIVLESIGVIKGIYNKNFEKIN
jgi:stage III sporulation protein AA